MRDTRSHHGNSSREPVCTTVMAITPVKVSSFVYHNCIVMVKKVQKAPVALNDSRVSRVNVKVDGKGK